MTYDIVGTGSKGNAVVINQHILIDCGVSFKSVKPYLKDIKLVLLTHRHFDHFNKRTISTVASERPTMRFACGGWMVQDVVECGVRKSNIDILTVNTVYNYGLFKIEPVRLVHDVPNFGYKIYSGGERLMYATDTNSLDGVEAKDFDLYMIEANYTEQDLIERIRVKQSEGIFPYEVNVKDNHLSKEKADDFIYRNIGNNGSYVYLHTHEGLTL